MLRIVSTTARACVALTLCLGALTACEGNDVKKTLGLNKSAPDEFRVVSRPPLSMPPDFTLEPPTTPGQSPEVEATRGQAKSLVLGEGEQEKSAPKTASPRTRNAPIGASSAEAELLRKAGADQADSSAREELYEQDLDKQEKKISTWEDITTLPDPGEPLVDAKKERERLQKNRREGKPAAEGETPEIKPTDRGILGKWLSE